MRAVSRRFVVLLSAALGALACEGPEAHPPLASSCVSGKSCSLGVGQVSVPATPTSGSDGGGYGAGGTAGVGAGTLTGTVVELFDDTFVSSVPFAAPAVVEAQSPTGSVLAANWDGITPFQLSGVEPSVTSWISVRPTSGTEHLRTLHPIATHLARVVELGLLRAEILDAVFSILTLPAQREVGAGQVVLVFSRASAASASGVAGVTATSPDAEFSAYAAGALWSSELAGTSSSGLAVVGNLPAPAFPGSNKRIFLGGTTNGFVDVRVAAGAVTLVGVPL